MRLKWSDKVPRKPRIWYPGAMYHITARGNRKHAIFHENKDYWKYLNLLENAQKNHSFTLHSYCLMPNHIHLQLETSDTSTSILMKEIQMNFAIYYNKKYDYVGHVFQDRYHAKLIESEVYFLMVNRYIHRNPLEGNIVTTLKNYPWSSYPSYLTSHNSPLISKNKTLQFFPSTTKNTYQQYIEEKEDLTIQILNEYYKTKFL